MPMAAIKLHFVMTAQLLLSIRGWVIVSKSAAPDVGLIQTHVLDHGSPGCVDNDAGAVQLAKDHVRVDDVSGCSDVGPYCADTNLSSQVQAVCCATCSQGPEPEPDVVHCQEHSDCQGSEFCYDGTCDSCSQCQFCSDAAYVDECGHCGTGFPLLETSPCHSHEYVVTKGALTVTHAWKNLSSDEQLLFLEKKFGELDKDQSSTLDVDELVGTLTGQDLAAIEAANGTLNAPFDSVLLPRASVQEFVDNHSAHGNAFLTLDEWLATTPQPAQRAASQKALRGPSCTFESIFSLPSTCSETQWVNNCGNACSNSCTSCPRLAHTNSSTVARVSRDSDSVARTSQELEFWGGRRRRRWWSVVTDVVDTVVDVVVCTVSCVTNCVWSCFTEAVEYVYTCVVDTVVNVLMSFGECLSAVMNAVNDAVGNMCGFDLIPTGCSGVWDCISEGASNALSFFECGFSILLDVLENMVMANLRCLPNIADGIRAALFPPEAIIATTVFEALWDFGERVVNGIYSEAAAVSIDFCWNSAPTAEFTDCGAFDFVSSMTIWDVLDVFGMAQRFADTVAKFTNCLTKTTSLPGLSFGIPTPFLNVDWTGGSWCAPSFVQTAAKGVIGVFRYISSGRMLDDLIIVGDNLLTNLQTRLEAVFCDEGDFTITLGVDLQFGYAVLGIKAQAGCLNGRFAAKIVGFATGRVSIFGAPYKWEPSASAFFSIGCTAGPSSTEWSYWESSLNGILAFDIFSGSVSLPLYPQPKLEFGYSFSLKLWPQPAPPPRLSEGEFNKTSLLPALRLLWGYVRPQLRRRRQGQVSRPKADPRGGPQRLSPEVQHEQECR
ncbi:unnamed protein product [Prorocentrum cordatum]|uniref:EF-hand domain-containing protein n=1 Tax=Prorocentrum cordatum TaxID=2364126 RepID=A0ABN9XY11_9DINO|nr:unnamed protein product [Polarella glacialis]